MKKAITLLGYIVTLILTAHLGVNAQVYISSTATGNNDGSSWANAYTDVAAAADAAPAGADLWIAAGEYNLSATLVLQEKDLNLYGGFVGTESSLDQRDLSNESIISGDVNADDVDGDLTTNAGDNLKHVLFIIESTATIIDGLVFEGGRGDLTGDFSNQNATGGGIFCNGEITFRNCKIRKNVARFGAGLYVVNTQAIPGIYSFIDCEISGNEGNSFGGGIYAGFGGTSISLTGCTLQSNIGGFGGGAYFAGSSGVTTVAIEDCTFQNNEAILNGGGLTVVGMARGTMNGSRMMDNKANRGAGISLQLTDFTMSDCSWSGNEALDNENGPGLGGGVYVQGGGDYTLTNCDLTANSGQSAGGGFFLLSVEGIQNKLMLDNCTMTDNTTPASGGGLYSQNSFLLDMKNSTWRDNSAADDSGGALYIDDDAEVIMDQSIFEGNSALWGGAILIAEGNNDVVATGCRFEGNSAQNQGGAMYDFEGSPWMLTGCEFIGNSSGDSGGALYADEGADWNIEDCSFEENSAGDWGGAIYYPAVEESMTIRRSSFIANQAVGSAGAIYHDGGVITIENSHFFDNEATGDGIGHAISSNNSEEVTPLVSLINNSFHHDATGLGAITTWSGADVQHAVAIQNCIFSGESDHWQIEAGNVTETSNGGNLSSNATMDDQLTHSTDLTSTDPLLSDVAVGDLSLQSASPAVNTGVASGAPVLDITGASRDGMPDRGAYEFLGTVSSRHFNALPGEVTILGNPTTDEIRTSWQSSVRGDFRVDVVDAWGRTLVSQQMIKNQEEVLVSMPTAGLTPGVYSLRLTTGSQASSSLVIVR